MKLTLVLHSSAQVCCIDIIHSSILFTTGQIQQCVKKYFYNVVKPYFVPSGGVDGTRTVTVGLLE